MHDVGYISYTNNFVSLVDLRFEKSTNKSTFPLSSELCNTKCDEVKTMTIIRINLTYVTYLMYMIFKIIKNITKVLKIVFSLNKLHYTFNKYYLQVIDIK